MGKSIDTWMWKDHLYDYWFKNGGDKKIEILDSVNWNVSVGNSYPCLSLIDSGMVLWRRRNVAGGSEA